MSMVRKLMKIKINQNYLSIMVKDVMDHKN